MRSTKAASKKQKKVSKWPFDVSVFRTKMASKQHSQLVEELQEQFEINLKYDFVKSFAVPRT